MEYLHTAGWGAISNFITKFSEKNKMELADVEIVSSIVLERKGTIKNFSLVKELEYKSDYFKRIGRPENIYVDSEKYDYAFFISIEFEQLFDVVDLQNLYLICDACRECRIVALISGIQSEYYKTSHFFTFLTECKGEIYESVFFKCDGIKHLQLSGIGVLSKFLPLVPIDASEDIRMRQRVEAFVSTEIFKEVLEDGKVEENVPRILTGAFKQLSKYRKKLKSCDLKQCAIYLGELNILSFLLFCFSLEGKEDSFLGLGEFNKELQKITLWSNGCIQLIENIVFHSNKKRGAFSFRILDGGTTYIREKYSLKDTHEKWIEMMIVDYAGCSRTRNIADKFRENLNTSNLKEAFEDLKPRDFFEVNENEKISCAWKQYYSEGRNVVNHYGLKIFYKVVKNSRGHFVAYSFSTHQPQRGEFYYDVNDMSVNMPQICLPGTGYSVLFPIGQENVNEEFDDYGIEEYEDKIDDQDILFNYKVIDKMIPIIEKAVSPQEKMDLINQIAVDLLNVEDLDRPVIISINADNFQGDMAEIVYKAMLLTLLQSSYKCHLIMYECKQEFIQMFLDVASLGLLNLGEKLNYRCDGQIVLYSAEFYEEIIIIPENWERTCVINRSNNFSRETRWKNYFEHGKNNSRVHYPAGVLKRYPFDVLAGERWGNSVFEKYVETVLNRSIQNQELGCKIEDTHMRLGSTIHVNHFYEAEILFGNSLFVERFALLIIKRMLKPFAKDMESLNASDKITLYGYTNYSEQTVFCTMQYLKKVFSGIDVDYAILERESEDRGFTHVDRIRYSTYFESGEAGKERRKRYFQDRKIVCVIPIASTLKTNEKMINLFLEENGKQCKSAFYRNFELILVGSTKQNKYWEKDGKHIKGKNGMEISPIPEFFVEVTLDYMEPLECNMCFPTHIIDEQPLIEVNAASTIPNQAIGLIGRELEECKINWQELHREEQRLEGLKDILLYRHLERNENHFLFYFQTERLIVQNPEEVCDWLKEIKEKVEVNPNDYVILFCPAHFSNAGFIEYVNNYVFGSAAVIVRDDVDKEYRCNFRTKFSNLRNFVEKTMQYNKSGGDERKIRLFYVDDAIITGHTFQRARSLAQSIMEDYSSGDRQKYAVFDGIFVLIDRNSKSSKWQYTGVNEEERLYAFRTVQISSIRNHGDACVYCNLAREAETLKKSSVTKNMEKYWRDEEKKFSVKRLGEYIREQKKIERMENSELKRQGKRDRAFRRLVCTNNAMIFLNEKYHGNCREKVLEQLLMLILEGSYMHVGEEAEYFLSYCKVLSRPFRVFDKAVKEAVFDFLLIISISSLSKESYDRIIASSEKKQYLKKEKIKEKFFEIEAFIRKFFSSQDQQQALLKVLLKQLTEMKSNFIMRESIMKQIVSYADKLGVENREKFVRYYKYLIKRITGVSSDTSKSLWLDRMLHNSWKGDENEIQQDIYVENVWIYQDAFQKLDDRVKIQSGRWKNILINLDGTSFKEELIKFEEEEIEEYLKPYQFKDFISLLQLYKMCDADNKLTEEGKIFVAVNFLLYRFVSANFENGLRREGAIDKGNLTKVDYIATCMKYIMGAKEVVIIMEFDAEYDLWENIIIERYNALLPESMIHEKIVWEPKKEYIILGSSEKKNGKWTIRDKEVVTKVKKIQKEKSWAEKGYAYDAADGFFWWELGHATEYPVYIFATWENSKQNNILEIGRLNRIRSVMQYYWQLNNLVFNKNNEVFFCEIAQQRKKNAIHSRQKAHTHTKSDIKLAQYDHMLESDKYREYYQSDLLMLLADLNVSEHYRNSLTAEYYLKGGGLCPREWNWFTSPFVKQKEFDIISSEAALTTKMIISNEVLFEDDLPLREDEKIIAFDYTNAESDSYLLIYSLMINAVSKNRGKVENDCVTVYCSCTSDGKLRLTNQIGENQGEKTPQQIMEELRYPPEEEHQGISLWSMSRYIKGVIACILDGNLKKMEKGMLPACEGELIRMKQQILQLLGEEFQISVERRVIDEKSYFSVLIPILAEKYEEQKEDCIK